MMYYHLKLRLALTDNMKTKNLFQLFPFDFTAHLCICLFIHRCKYCYVIIKTDILLLCTIWDVISIFISIQIIEYLYLVVYTLYRYIDALIYSIY